MTTVQEECTLYAQVRQLKEEGFNKDAKSSASEGTLQKDL